MKYTDKQLASLSEADREIFDDINKMYSEYLQDNNLLPQTTHLPLMHFAALNNSVDALRVLISLGAEYNLDAIYLQSSFTPLELALFHEHTKSSILLMKHHASVKAISLDSLYSIQMVVVNRRDFVPCRITLRGNDWNINSLYAQLLVSRPNDPVIIDYLRNEIDNSQQITKIVGCIPNALKAHNKVYIDTALSSGATILDAMNEAVNPIKPLFAEFDFRATNAQHLAEAEVMQYLGMKQ